MSFQVCLAVATRPTETGKIMFSILERAPLRFKAHFAIWKILRTHAEKASVIDAAHPSDSFPAKVLDLTNLADEVRTELTRTMAEARESALSDERTQKGGGPFSRTLNGSFDQQREWLALRSLMVQALGQNRTATRTRQKKQRRLILIDS
jgi:hypothetical protein